MKKRILPPAIALIIILSISALPASAASNLAANPTASTVYVNGAATAFEAYNIGGNNYFKLRDLAYALNGTAKQFEVGYDNATKAITLTTGRAYTPDGGEMARGDGAAKTASPTASRIYLDGRELNLTVYLIGGNNFFKLRDLMEAIDVFVGYDDATKAITLDTGKGYAPEASAPTPTPPQSGSNTIIGTWLYGDQTAINWSYEEWTNEDTVSRGYNLDSHVAILFVFRADGTYLRRFRAYNQFGDTFLDHTGKYRVESNKIIVFDRIETCIDFDYPEESYSNRPLAGEYTYYYEHTQSGYGEYAVDALFIETSEAALPNTNWYYDKH